MDTNESDVRLARLAFAQALRFELARSGLSVRDLSHLTRRGGAHGIAETTLGGYVRAERSPRWPEQVQIAEALGMDVVDLISAAVEMHKRLRAEGQAEITPEIASGEITR